MPLNSLSQDVGFIWLEIRRVGHGWDAEEAFQVMQPNLKILDSADFLRADPYYLIERWPELSADHPVLMMNESFQWGATTAVARNLLQD